MRILLLLFIFGISHGLYFTLEPKKEQCFNLTATKARKIYGAYVISGKGEDMAVCKVTSPTGKTEFLSPGKTTEGKFEIPSAEAGTYQMCFRMLDSNAKTVSFEYEFADGTIQSENVAKDSDIDPVSNSLRDLARSFDMVYRNLHFY
jgi:hypothetical protein